MLNELLALAFLALLGAGAGALFSSPLVGLLAGVGAWSALQFVRLLRLGRWLDADIPVGGISRPVSSGLWGDVYRRIADLRRAAAVSGDRRRHVRLEDGVAALPYGFVVVTREGRVEWFNNAASGLLRLSRAADVGREITHLVRQSDFVAAIERDEGSAELELSVDEKTLAVYISSFDDGDHRLITVQDLSRMRHLERARSELLGNVAHELKTPLTVIRGYAEIIGAGKLSGHNRISDVAGHIVGQAERMNRIVDDLLVLEKLDEKPLGDDVPVVRLRRLTEDVTREMIMVNGANRCRVENLVDEGAALYGEPGELHSVLSNLVSNAVRYSPEGGVVRVRWSRCGRDGRLSVSDQGQGIDPVHLPRLTERFYRVDRGRSREAGGTGLGLAIVKHVLQRYGASLHVESEPGKGSTFHCDFPGERCAG